MNDGHERRQHESQPQRDAEAQEQTNGLVPNAHPT
jgi:hypothetical protein